MVDNFMIGFSILALASPILAAPFIIYQSREVWFEDFPFLRRICSSLGERIGRGQSGLPPVEHPANERGNEQLAEREASGSPPVEYPANEHGNEQLAERESSENEGMKSIVDLLAGALAPHLGLMMPEKQPLIANSASLCRPSRKDKNMKDNPGSKKSLLKPLLAVFFLIFLPLGLIFYFRTTGLIYGPVLLKIGDTMGKTFAEMREEALADPIERELIERESEAIRAAVRLAKIREQI